MEIYFVRHGQTIWNVEKRFQGLSDSPLTELGITQAKLLGEKLKDIKFDKFYSTSLKRAYDTANYIKGNREQKVEIFDDFVEISMGDMEGIKQEDFKKLYPEQVKNFFFNQLEYDPSSFGGENFLEVRERVIRGLNKFIELNKNYERVLAVSHGATLKTLLHYISGKDISTLSDEAIPKNTSYTIVKYENGKFEIIDFSNTSHLEGKL
ncbi:phosphoglycerate mutase [Fusobacterium nucleatum YWH7199]|uniref:Phosphoglycerate mutase family protein n=1 Tax=Fusobacterium nucleatum TaxID=851 RepID=A0A133NXE4_FUSNU|nr:MULTISPECIES: histidine phosphatase family protein [Fusobacterium]KXA20939.1 phosphoglycerate mutase family protein [Fusobacterium nucleatum]MCL4576951.1 phosphoglycerate mutase [Fusobacterium nucleatum YWH7056]MCL4581274.1 phosphoglycerate mutase [Fusobacterium nucleatum YWH7199]MCL4583856.1 phosphoglycerate mutase [Fusobacterium nucleatum YWH7054]MCL4593346.1 phosphoglycerate mutase [Fusobacterium nucleatum YWH7053]